MKHLTICYLTARKDCKIEWFLDSLSSQMNDYPPPWSMRIVAVDFLRDQRVVGFGSPVADVKWISPKPSVWQGPHRLTKQDFFAASNARNTGLCLAPDGYIAFVDDLSVLSPGWLNAVREAMDFDGITLGAYWKVNDLQVENGEIKYFKFVPGARDGRWDMGNEQGPVSCPGDLMYGCSFVAPVEALLTVGGFPEFCDGMGFEDVIMGQVLENAGYKFRYDRRMLTYESEELHHVEPAFKRSDFGVSPNDKSHRALGMAKSGMKYFENYYEGGIRKMREEVLAGNPFPVVNNPQHEWFTGIALKDL